MAPLAEPWRPLRGAAAHLWWSYYRVLKKREGVIADEAKANGVLNEATANGVSNKVVVAKRSSTKAKIAAGKLLRKKPGSKP
jgi:DNA-3-methyladenine glycosylase II